jgi:GNAT superfamily N-acetyltransferase
MSIDKTSVEIRRFDAARDGAALRQCVIDQQNFHRALESTWPDGEAIAGQYMTYLDEECAAHNGRIFMAHDGERPAGFVCVVATTTDGSPHDPVAVAWIHDLYVAPEHRRHGVATMLMEEAERFARSEGARVVRLGLLDSNEGARGFYARNRFHEYTHVLTKDLA